MHKNQRNLLPSFTNWLDDEQVRVIDYHLKPREKEPLHSHPSGVLVYYYTDAKMRVTLPDGTNTAVNKAGDVVWREPGDPLRRKQRQ